MVKNSGLFTICLLLVSMFFVSCSKDDDMDPVDEMASYTGDFVPSAHPTSGAASINMEKTLLSLKTFKTDAGPDLNIYLASNLSDITGDYIDLGAIKGVDGNYTYNLPPFTDYTVYKYVVVWCVAFNVNFGYATLKDE